MADQPELCSVCEEYFAEFFCRKCDRKICQECDEVIHMIPEKTVHERIQLKQPEAAMQSTMMGDNFSPQGAPSMPIDTTATPQFTLSADYGVEQNSHGFQTSVASATVMQMQGKEAFHQQLESTLHQQQTVLGHMQQASNSASYQTATGVTAIRNEASKLTSLQSSNSIGSTSSNSISDCQATPVPPDNPEKYYDVVPPWEPPADDEDEDIAKPLAVPTSAAPAPPAPPPPQHNAPPRLPSLITAAGAPVASAASAQPMSRKGPPGVAAGIAHDASQVPTEALAQLKESQPAVNEVSRRQSMMAPDTSVLKDKFVQRGAASFVAQLRATKDNPDILVSLILTKEMLLVARKPSYKTMHTLKFSAGLRAFPVPKDPNGVIILSSDMDEPLVFGCGQALLLQETLLAFVKLGGFDKKMNMGGASSATSTSFA
eukprot:CAMPEP_0173073804 /NCGR_PEP_ID=MMETSP1102-20130122/10628_1 /TAXON_ID=49646 /ORGANISM="Geminigera sp., Strain Caron Lab Isolate" /LENGTH=429 /DNA_ID=CAMNT_0013942729 /DNA_START=41 /DNA_END=1327 /DNA_ORIENTATION=+